MAKYETRLSGDFNQVIAAIDDGILRGSISASCEDGSDFVCGNGNVRCAVRVYERYSMIGSNRVSLSVTLFGEGNEMYLSAITSGGSQAVFFKFNTFGEQAFLKRIVDIVAAFEYR
ncbi:MAG: DUF6054 family protein [Clostridia bacterium]|nr:DUF6054 family protein [Clostridia bacterium]